MCITPSPRDDGGGYWRGLALDRSNMATKLKTFSVRNVDRGTVLMERGKPYGSMWSRFWGLMLKKGVAQGEGILLTRSSSIHSFFMRFRFDAVFIDKENRVVKIVPAMKQWRIAFGGKGAKDTLEMPAGAAERAQTQVGDVLAFDEVATG
jgi:uncharacterized membrane protein (UPF0127 family)